MSGAVKAAQRESGNASRAKTVIVGTAGHIDHGKTALVYALTGTDTDRLPEEKHRGITIDLGFAALHLHEKSGQEMDLSLIDVPGHHAFVRNMLAGAGGIDCVMLVIAADEGIKPQTREHLLICSLLGVRTGLVVLTKRDSVSAERLRAAQAEAVAFLKDSFLAGAPIVAVSAHTGQGMDGLRAALAHMAAQVPSRSTDQVTRVPVDRVFSVRGFGTVVTGTLQAGSVLNGETLELASQERPVRVRGLQVHGGSRDAALAPQRVAINLAAVETSDVRRGDMLLAPGTLKVTTVVDVEIERLPDAPDLRHRSRVHLYAFSAECFATVLRYDAEGEEGSERVLARLKLLRALPLAPGDRFVLRLPSPAMTVGGGRVLDARPMPRFTRKVSREWLRRLQTADAAEQAAMRVERRGRAGLLYEELVGETGLRREALVHSLAVRVKDGSLVPDAAGEKANALVSRSALDSAKALMLRELGRAPETTISTAELRSRLRLPLWVAELALRELQAAGRLATEPARGVRLATRNASGKPADDRLSAVEALYAQGGLAAPIVSEVSAKMGMAQETLRPLLTLLLRQGKLVRMGSDDLLVPADAVERLKSALQRHRGEVFDVARFKGFTGLTRKHAIPLLEYLDGARITQKQGTNRRIV